MGTRLVVNNALEFSFLAFTAGCSSLVIVVFMVQKSKIVVASVLTQLQLLGEGSTGCGVSAWPTLNGSLCIIQISRSRWLDPPPL